MNKQIIEKQNEKQFIDYLKAQRVAYNQCKNYQFFDIISILIAIVLPIIGIIRIDWVNHLGAFGVLWTIIYLVAEYYRKQKSEQGAKIQEQFDTKLYGMNWNKILCQNKVSKDTLYDLAKKYTKDDLQNWYSLQIGKELPKSIQVLLCQRINFSWELGLRRRFMLFLIILLLTYYGIFIVVFAVKNIGFYDVLILLSPSLSFLIYGVQNSLSLSTNIKSKNDTLETIDDLIKEYSKNQSLPSDITLRQIQDVLFSSRISPEVIPNWYYEFYKKGSEIKADDLIISIKQNL
jgi:hypothetical protein